MNMITGSVGRNSVNRRTDVMIVQTLINANLFKIIPVAPLMPDGVCGTNTIFAIETFQRRVLSMNPPDGRVDPGGRTFSALTGGGTGPIPPKPVPPSPAPPQPEPGPGPATAVSRPAKMRENAWQYLLKFTKKHEGAVFHMYNNRTASSTKQDVTCGIGFLLDPKSAVLQAWVKPMFFNKATKLAATDALLLSDWDICANLARTGTNLGEYGNRCSLQMFPDKVYERMAIILRDQKYAALLQSFPADFANFENFPSAAQVFSVSFAYGRLPFDFPMMRASIRAANWTAAAAQCRVKGMSESKNRAHSELLMLAQKVVDERLPIDTLPAGIL
jgi:hypothetical protein